MRWAATGTAWISALPFILAALAFPAAAPALAAASCSGVTLTVATRHAPFIAGPAIAHGETWAAESNGKVEVVTFPFAELQSRLQVPMQANQPYDVIIYPPAWQAEFAPYLAAVPEQLTRSPAFEDIHPAYRDRLMLWGEDYRSITLDGDVLSGIYRRDLFENPAHQKAFQDDYRHPLAPPATWEDYYEIAEFFTNRVDGVYGTAEAFRRGGQLFWLFFGHAAAYANHPENPGSMFFDPVTMTAQISNPAWLKALEDYRHSLKFAPKRAIDFDSGDVRTAFATGKVAMSIDWPDIGLIAADPEQSLVAGKLGFFMLPGSRRIFNDVVAKRRPGDQRAASPDVAAAARGARLVKTRIATKGDPWDRYRDVVHAPFMAFGGWMASVPTTSSHRECAFDYIMWYGNEANSAADMVQGGTGINPYRSSHFRTIEPWLGRFDADTARRYLEVQRSSIEADNLALDFRLPGYFDYADALEIELVKALRDEVRPQDALDAAAARWDAITRRRGLEAQRDAYRTAMGLPPLEPSPESSPVAGPERRDMAQTPEPAAE
jgi:multiple sugar transport system substrate-binding protein